MAKWTTAHNTATALALLGLALAWPAAGAQEQAEFPLPTEAMLLQELPAGSTIEVRMDRDINGDAIPDTAFVGGTEDERRLVVLVGYKDELEWGHEVAQAGKLPTYPLGPAQLSVKKNVLVVEDLTGGTTATNAIYRYRWDARLKRLQLIGLDAERYSRTNTHDAFKISWNLLTGAHDTVRGILDKAPKGGDDAAYRYTKPSRTQHKTQPVYIEDTPDADALIDAEVVPPGEDRD